MKRFLVPALFATTVAACVTPAVAPVPAPVPVPTADQARGVREALNQAVDQAVNQLGRTDGFWSNPQLRIPLPDPLQRMEKNLRRFGLERHAEEFAETLNRAAEEAMPAVKPALLDAVRNLTLADAEAIVRGDDQAATRYFRAQTEVPLQQQLRPVIAAATARVGVTASYKRLVRKAVFLDKLSDPARLDLDAHVTRAALDGLYRTMAEEEQRIRRDPRARTTELLRQVFR